MRKYAQTVAGACVMRLQNYADAEDRFQNTFVKLLTKAPSFQDEKHLRH
ncbi:MAG: sigma factor [Ruminococcus sp.]|nr:sigma factor [Ruminococcus sp.]